MAKATKRTVTRPVHMITLELSMAEARALRTVNQNVGGHSTQSDRKYINDIDAALLAVNVGHSDWNATTGTITFRDWKGKR